jgi:hypothetical protein
MANFLSFCQMKDDPNLDTIDFAQAAVGPGPQTHLTTSGA